MSRLRDICKIGQGKDCCKYLVCGSEGLHCAKIIEDLKFKINLRTDMTAKSDNCEGFKGVIDND